MLSNKTKNTVLFDLIHALRTTTHQRQVNSHIQKNILQYQKYHTEYINTNRDFKKENVFSSENTKYCVINY